MTLANAPQIGVNLAGLATLESLGVTDPKMIYVEAEEVADLWSNHVRIAGGPIVIWNYGFITQTERDILRAYCTGASEDVCIETQVNDNAEEYRQFNCVMYWPVKDEGESIDATRRVPFQITFLVIEDVTPG